MSSTQSHIEGAGQEQVYRRAGKETDGSGIRGDGGLEPVFGLHWTGCA